MRQELMAGALVPSPNLKTRKVATGGDGFVVAPDGRRAGIVWEVGEGDIPLVAPPDESRWGVYAVWFPRMVRTVDDLVFNFRQVLPELKKRYQDVSQNK
jgi:hypothetical protein